MTVGFDSTVGGGHDQRSLNQKHRPLPTQTHGTYQQDEAKPGGRGTENANAHDQVISLGGVLGGVSERVAISARRVPGHRPRHILVQQGDPLASGVREGCKPIRKSRVLIIGRRLVDGKEGKRRARYMYVSNGKRKLWAKSTPVTQRGVCYKAKHNKPHKQEG